jgi:tetratricopeptide (TPR) repeat protein
MEKKRYFLLVVALFAIGSSLYFLITSFLNMNLQMLLRNISLILFGIAIILFYYKYKNKKLLYLGYFTQLACVIIFIIYNIITIKYKRITSLIYIISSSFMFYTMSIYLYRTNNVLILKLLSTILFFNKSIKYKLAWIFFENNNYIKSINLLKNYKDNESYYLLAMNYEQLKDYNNAIEIYTKILDTDKNERPDILYNRGAIYREIGKQEEAIMDFNKCIECKEPDSKAYIALGVIKDEIGEYKEAKELFIKGDSLDGSYKDYIPEKYK